MFGGCGENPRLGRVRGSPVNYVIGAQNIVDIISTLIDKFGGSGKVDAKGRTDCDGTVKQQDVEWDFY